MKKPAPQFGLGRIDKFQLQQHLSRVANSQMLTHGQYVGLLEEEIAAWSGMEAISFNSCGSGLFAVASALKWENNDKAIVPTNTFFATGAMMKEAGYEVTLADVGIGSFSLDVPAIQAQHRKAERTVVLTHVGGSLAPAYAYIAAYCNDHGLILIEDAAHVLGVKENNIVAGTFGKAAVFSLYPTKAIPAGDGGVVVTHDKELAAALREFRNYGKYTENGVLRHSRGFNLRMDEWTACVAWLQFRRRNAILEMRQEDADKLNRLCPPLYPVNVTNWYKYPVNADFKAKRQSGKIYQASDQLATAMKLGGQYPRAERLAASHICLPVGEGMYEGMTTAEVEEWLFSGE